MNKIASIKKSIFITLVALLLSSCEHRGQDVIKFTGEYRYFAGIAEFFDCKERVKYFVAKAGINTDLQEAYLKLGVKDKDDVYIQIQGYLKEVAQMDGVDPATLFVPVKLLSLDKNRGCERGSIQQGR